MQTQWPGLGSAIELTSLDVAGGGPHPWTGSRFGTSLPPQSIDSVARSWWGCGAGKPSSDFGYGWGGTGFFALFGIASRLVSALQQLANALMNNSGNQGWNQSATGPQQRFENVDVSSTGDPHIAEVGTTGGRNGGRTVDDRWDSMTAHDDLVHSNDVEGGYRVSTAVTAPGTNGVTYNQSATVHSNFDQDAITMNRDGSYAIYDNGEEVQLGKGESATLSGGERVDVNQDGSLTVSAQGVNGGTINTTLRSTGAGVDVTTHGHNIGLGGDAVTHGTPKTIEQHPRHPRHDPQPHHPHHPRVPPLDAATGAPAVAN